MNSTDVGSVRNRLLSSLPDETLASVLPDLRRVEMPFRSIMHNAGKPISTIYFPDAGWVSLLMPMADGTLAEVGVVGFEGLVGLPAVFGAERWMTEAMVQCEGTALGMRVDALRGAMDELPAFRRLLLRYAHVFTTQVAMTAVCNIRHPLQKRLARWLLIAHDRSATDDFPMTHEFLSTMLGVRRAGVSVAASAFQEAGLIRYGRGRMQVLNRTGLEHAACECHRVVERELEQLFRPGDA